MGGIFRLTNDLEDCGMVPCPIQTQLFWDQTNHQLQDPKWQRNPAFQKGFNCFHNTDAWSKPVHCSWAFLGLVRPACWCWCKRSSHVTHSHCSYRISSRFNSQCTSSPQLNTISLHHLRDSWNRVPEIIPFKNVDVWNPSARSWTLHWNGKCNLLSCYVEE